MARDDEEEDDDSRDSDADFIFVHFWGYRLPSLGPSDTNQILILIRKMWTEKYSG